VVFRFEHRDVRVAERHVHDCKRTRGLRDLARIALGRELTGNQVPASARRLRAVEHRDCGAVGRPLRAVHPADGLELVEVGC
jgi:hypothetical protein